ncbi:hypothetical protein BWI17_17270 [Betaproteobacteria bacterium GR16-43]|nr:hypothetical protein BWI17_17270 [Betaproteobacteria bacterium GR16-43]
MSQLFRYAYLAELFLWVPLAYCVVTLPASRRWLIGPAAFSLLAAVYEGYMTFVWERTVVAPIRVDIFLVVFMATIVNVIAGLGLAFGGKGTTERKPRSIIATLCLAIPVLAIAGYLYMRADTAALDVQFEQGRKYRFETAFRDDATEKRVFGDIKPNANPWAGYYVGDGADDRFKHLVINEAGQFWLYGTALYLSEGYRKPDSTNADRYEAQGSGRMNQKMRLALRRQADGPYLLEVDFGYGVATPPKTVPVQRATPPRFPQTSSPNDEVKFVGVFSGTYTEGTKSFWLVQFWLWESKGGQWGLYVHDNYVPGQRREFIHPEPLEIRCRDQCRELTFETSRGRRKLQRTSNDEFKGMYDSPEREVIITRGEILPMPGFLLDLAPLASRRQNEAWLSAVLAGQMVTWDVPSSPDRRDTAR